ncbi:hypothetical protein DEFDS_0527 [Deferribacter desulfuricans SSM1]|uniref:Magnesium transporter MgtE intracellular domain-containing protein n=1 Tax=Deferribacter desulfuricans (strain DSM 14783 / JCM 11476 / NBRC 101012 / SSM1) TaxID=639282 RepID=D3PBP8_DEFDS|nr:hypothetical protein [Deferribacter desulfuricans]BAI80021.1 hypothetical protein DEFDS_0527 [Deferribacter desulfuricans SSM1]
MIMRFSLILVIFFTFLGITFSETNLADINRISKHLKEKEKQLQLKEEELKKKEEELKMLEEILNKKSDEIDKKLAKLQKLYDEIKKIEDEDLDRLAKYYASTNPKSAAKIIAKMDLNKAVQLFKRMSPMAAGGILSQMGKIDPDKASKISEAMTPKKIDIGEVK